MNNPYMTKPVKIVDIEKHTNIDWTFHVEKDRDVALGQFVQVSVPKFGEAPISISDFTDDTIELTIRAVGKVTEEIFKKKIGDTLQIRGPYGNSFNFEDFYDKEVILVSGGTGLAPVKGLANHFANNTDKIKSFRMICGFKSAEDILFTRSFEKWEKTVQVCLTIDREEEGWTGETGFVTDHVRELDLQDLEDVSVIMVGPPPMLRFTAKELSNLGVRDHQITVSYERRMSCGIGKCGNCKIDDTYICLDGPIFTYDKAAELID